MAQGSRPDRVGEEIRQELATLLVARGPRSGHRLRHADAREGLARPPDGAGRTTRCSATTRRSEDTDAALERATPFLRRQIGARIRLRRVPELRFEFDESVENQDRIERILLELQAERDARERARGPRTRRTEDQPDPRTRGPRPEGPDLMSAAAVAAALRERQSFILTSHARPDGDAIGSQLALALRARALGKSVRLINRDPGAGAVPALSRRRAHRVAARATGPADAVVMLECSDIDAAGRRRPRARTSSSTSTITSATRCTATSTGSTAPPPRAGRWSPTSSTRSACRGRRRSPRTCTSASRPTPADSATARCRARTFEICRRIAETGVDPAALSRADLRQLRHRPREAHRRDAQRMELHHGDRLAVLDSTTRCWRRAARPSTTPKGS